MSSYKVAHYIKASARLMSTSTTRFDIPSRLSEYLKISPFNKPKAPNWWEGINQVKLQQFMTPVRVELLKKNLIDAGLVADDVDPERPFENLNILEVGCGGGVLAEAIAKLGARVTAIDPNPEHIRDALEVYEHNLSLVENLQFEAAKVEEFAKRNAGKFDVIVASEVIEYIADKELFARNALKCLRPGGSVFFTTMNRTPMSGLYYLYLLEDLMKIMPKGKHDYGKLVRPKEITDLFRKHNCITTNVDGFTLNPFTGAWIRVGFPHLNFALHAIKQTTTN